MATGPNYRLANAIFAWEKEIFLPFDLTDGSTEFGGHCVNVPISEIDNEFCLDFANPELRLSVLEKIERQKINSLVVPLERVSIVPFFGFKKSTEIAGITGDLTFFSFVRQSQQRRHGRELAAFWEILLGRGMHWLRYSRPAEFIKYANHSDEEMRKFLNNSFVDDYLRLWDRLTEHPSFKFRVKCASDEGRFDVDAFKDLDLFCKIDVLDDWLNTCAMRTRALLRLRNGLAPNFRNPCTQEVVGHFLVLSQAAISHIEREKFGDRCDYFCNFLLRKFNVRSS